MDKWRLYGKCTKWEKKSSAPYEKSQTRWDRVSMRYNKLVINGEIHTIKDLEKQEDKEVGGSQHKWEIEGDTQNKSKRKIFRR